MIVTPKIEHVQVIVTEIKQMTLRLYLSYLIAKVVIPFTLMLYTLIFSVRTLIYACSVYNYCSHVEQIAKA